MSTQNPEETTPQNSEEGLYAETDRYIGKRLKAYRERAGLLVSHVAKALDLPEAQIQDIEAGTEHASASKLFELGKVLNLPVANFFALGAL